MEQTNRFPSQYILKTLNIINYAGIAVDIVNALVEVDIQMDIFNNTLHGTLILQDKGDFQQNIPLIGEERLMVEFANDKESGYLKFEFYIYQQAEKMPYGDGAFVYKMPFSSVEFLKNQEILVRESFYEKNIVDIVNKCVKKISPKPLVVDDTIGTLSYITPSIHPFEVINYCLPRAISKNYPNGAGYVFYEDNIGYCLRTIESLFKGDVLKYNFNNKNFVSTDFNNELYSVSNWEIIQQYNVLDNMSKGLYGSRVFEIDPYTRKYTQLDYNYFSKFAETEHVESNNVNNNFHTSRFPFKNVFKGHTKCYPSYGYQNKAKNLGVRYSQLNQVSNGLKLILEVPGNTEINVGRVIELDYPNHSKNDDQQLDLYMKGKYLVTAVRYILKGDSFKTVMEVIKDGYYDNHERHNRMGMLN